jgi:hypothetical protein
LNKSTTKYHPAIVIPAFKRDRSLSRLLQTVNNAHYPTDGIQLIISIDQGGTAAVKNIAKNFDFKYGNVQVIEHSKKLGLKNHIIRCGDLALEYGSVIVLEEDLIVSPGFYTYTQRSIDFYKDERSIAGISLYSQRFNETTQLPFEPFQTEYSIYFMKLVCSWGQAWTSSQWKEFKNWYSQIDKSNSSIEEINHLPDNVKKWSKYSWKKFFNAYMLKHDKYFVYPYSSFSTHCGDEEGEHIKGNRNLLQVPLSGGDSHRSNFEFPDFRNHLIRYDMYMEAFEEFISTMLPLCYQSIAVDLYGMKSPDQFTDKEYILSSKKYKNPIKSFPLRFKPLELNVKFESYDEEIPFFYLYRTEDVINLDYTKPNYYRFANYFSYQNFFSRNILKGFLKNLLNI